MDNNEKNLEKDQPIQSRDIKPNIEQKQETRTIFSREEIESTVKGFVLAYIRGRIKIVFPTSEDFEIIKKRSGEKSDFKDSFNTELKGKEWFLQLIEIISGIKPSSPDQLEVVKNEVFKLILIFRSGQRIDGLFFDYSLEEKMKDLEKKLDATNDVIVQLVKWFRGSANK